MKITELGKRQHVRLWAKKDTILKSNDGRRANIYFEDGMSLEGDYSMGNAEYAVIWVERIGYDEIKSNYYNVNVQDFHWFAEVPVDMEV